MCCRISHHSLSSSPSRTGVNLRTAHNSKPTVTMTTVNSPQQSNYENPSSASTTKGCLPASANTNNSNNPSYPPFMYNAHGVYANRVQQQSSQPPSSYSNQNTNTYTNKSQQPPHQQPTSYQPNIYQRSNPSTNAQPPGVYWYACARQIQGRQLSAHGARLSTMGQIAICPLGCTAYLNNP